MIVLCVGTHSKYGEFTELVHQENLPDKSALEKTIEDFAIDITKIVILVIIF